MKLITLSAAALVGGLLGAQDVPPPPKPQDNGPSLEVTMKFIQDKLNNEGDVSYRSSSDSIPDTVNRFEISNAAADIASCTLSWRLNWSFESGGTNFYFESSLRLSFRDVTKLEVESFADAYSRAGGAGRISPDFWQLHAVMNSKSVHRRTTSKSDGKVTDFDEKDARLSFHDEDMAQRMAKAMLHAVELCGGGNKDPF